MSAKAKEVPPGSGKWRVVVNFNNKRRSRNCESKREALAYAREINRRMDLGVFNLGTDEEDRVKTFREYADEWLSRANLKYGTMANYRIIYRKHVDTLLDMPIDKITRLNVKDLLVSKLNDGLSMSYVKNIKAFINNVIDRAMDDGVIQYSPAARLKKLEGRSQVVKDLRERYIPKEELTMILDAFMKHKPQYYALALTLARTGMRVGEAVALQWSDLDFSQKIIHVQRSRGKGGRIETPKSGRGRIVDMSAQLSECLNRRRVEMLSESIRAGKRNPWVFPGNEGSPMSQGHFTDSVWNPILAKLGIRYRVHDLRHSFASQMLSLGHPITTISKMLGHSSITITHNLYIHLIKDTKGTTDCLDDVRKVEKVVPKWKEM